ncbi:uncharacterized protein TNCV_294321 [Trichonephila clavipes]|nr:uncharacterized protein TNCV_294321 [Trichonephila clavipes]
MDWQMMDYAKMLEQAKMMDGDEFARRLSAVKTDGIYRIGGQEVDISDLVNRMNSRRKQPEPKRIAVEPPPEETDTDKCRRHKEMQKRIKMTNGRLSYLEHCIRSEKEFPDLTDADAPSSNSRTSMMNSSSRRSTFWGNKRTILRHRPTRLPPPKKLSSKGLLISTEIHEIQDDLTSQGFNVEKVAQLTRSKTKAPLPIFMVELEKKPNSPDIFKLKKCCYLAVQVDAFNRRPGVSQCYNCNLFNHSSKNCFMHTRCLKCGESHRTNDCPIKEKIQNPVCINCNKTGHMANWSQCEEFPKKNPEKGETTRNRNTSTESNKTSKKVTPTLSSQLPSRALRNKILPRNPGRQ